jgi:putative hemolysin
MLQHQENNQVAEITKNFIDLEKVFANKNPKLLKALPGFIISYLKRVIHQEELNGIIWQNRDRYGVDFVRNIVESFGVIVNVHGIDKLPVRGKQLIAANHPLGGLDGMALMSEVGKIRRDFLFPVNDLLMHIPNLRELFIPVNKHGSNAENIRIFNETFDSDILLLYFPAGLVSRKINGKIVDLDWKKTFLTKSIKYKRDIIPVHISGRNSNFFYNLANLRKFFGIKANIEMLYLVDEMFKQKNKIINITFGDLIPYQTFDKRHTHAEWANILKEHIYALGRGEKHGMK